MQHIYEGVPGPNRTSAVALKEAIASRSIGHVSQTHAELKQSIRTWFLANDAKEQRLLLLDLILGLWTHPDEE